VHNLHEEHLSGLLHIDSQLCFAVYAAAHAFTHAYKPLLGELDITYPQYLVLMVLWKKDGRTVKDIGDKLHLDSGTLTPLLKRLEAAGLLRRCRDQEDARQLSVTLTPEGWSMRERAATVRERLVCAIGIPEVALQALRRDLDELTQILRATDFTAHNSASVPSKPNSELGG